MGEGCRIPSGEDRCGGIRAGWVAHPPLLSCGLYRCKKFGVPIEKIYNKTQREKFAWAIDMADEDFEF